MQSWNNVDKRDSSYSEEGDFCDPSHTPDPEIQGDKDNLYEFMVKNPVRNSMGQGDLDLSLAVRIWQSDVIQLPIKSQKVDLDRALMKVSWDPPIKLECRRGTLLSPLWENTISLESVPFPLYYHINKLMSVTLSDMTEIFLIWFQESGFEGGSLHCISFPEVTSPVNNKYFKEFSGSAMILPQLRCQAFWLFLLFRKTQRERV